jgi:hypothetical protein
MSADVRLLIKKLAIFLRPFMLYAAAIVAIDPYNYFNSRSDNGNDHKQEISFKLNYAMWKMIEFRRHPKANLLLGDSRMMDLHAEEVREVSGSEYYNFAYGGGSLKEAISTFEFASGLTDLRRVTVGLDLNTYNGSDSKDRVSEVKAALRNPLLYLTNNTVMLAAWKLVTSAVTGNPARIGAPVGDRDAFWRQQLDVTARVYLANYRDPGAYRAQLRKIAETCHSRGIELVFIIFPSHKDLMDKIDQYGLEEANRVMREDLTTMGTVYDFAWDNALTGDKESFRDPFHFSREVAAEIIESVWGGTRDHVRIYGGYDPAAVKASVVP